MNRQPVSALAARRSPRSPGPTLLVGLVGACWLALGPLGLAPVRAQPPAESSAAIDYIILIDTSYSMLLDPGDPERAAAEVAAQSGAHLDARGRLIVNPPVPGALDSGLLSKVKALVGELLASAADGTSVAVYAFNTGVVSERVARLDATTRRDLLDYVAGLGASGKGTAIYDSMGQALERVKALRLISELPRQATIFLFTDGEENQSRLSFEDIIKRYTLLRSERNHLLFWRYYVPEPEVEGVAQEGAAREGMVQEDEAREASTKAPEVYEALTEAGVEFHDIQELDESFAPERVRVRPPRLDLGEALPKGPVLRKLVLEMDVAREEPTPVRLSAEFPDAAAQGLLVHVRPERYLLPPNQKNLTLEVEFSLAPSSARPEGPRSFEGALRLTSRKLLLFDPAEIPVALEIGAPPAEPAATVTTARPVAAALLFLAALGGALLAWWFWLRRRDGASVLIAAGDEPTRLLALGALEGQGLALLTAHHLDQAWETLTRSRPKLLVLDGELPDAGSQRLLDRWRANGRARKTPILWLAGEGGASGPEASNNGLFIGRLERPLLPEEVRRRALELLRR